MLEILSQGYQVVEIPNGTVIFSFCAHRGRGLHHDFQLLWGYYPASILLACSTQLMLQTSTILYSPPITMAPLILLGDNTHTYIVDIFLKLARSPSLLSLMRYLVQINTPGQTEANINIPEAL